MKVRYVMIAAALLACASCSKIVEQPEQEGVLMTYMAYQEGAQDTRTMVQDGGTQVLWEPADEIKLFFKDSAGKFVSQNSEPAGVADFTGELSVLVGANEGAGSSNLTWGLYPYREDAAYDGESVTTTLPSEQTGRAGSFARDTHISLAQSGGNKLAFYNVTGGLRFSLTQEGISSVIFEGNEGEVLAGTIKLAFADGVPAMQEVTDGESVVTLTAPDGGTFQPGRWYYIETVPVALTNGFTMVFAKGSETATLNSSGSFSISRGKYGSISDADEGLVFKELWKGEIGEPLDLGLSVRWASWNVGASKPEEYGCFFAWGETSPKSEYSWLTYKFEMGTGTNGPFSKYVTDTSYGIIDNKTVLDADDDAACVNWGGSWRMPTAMEQDELHKNCTWTWTSINGVAGYKVTSDKPGYTNKWIFLPRTGAGYWSSSLETRYPSFAYYMYNYLGYTDRRNGLSVRPVTE